MTFKAGEVHVICPKCGAPVTIPVSVASVVPQRQDESTAGYDPFRGIQVTLQPVAFTQHKCKMIGR